jgi:hypothetical protein
MVNYHFQREREVNYENSVLLSKMLDIIKRKRLYDGFLQSKSAKANLKATTMFSDDKHYHQSNKNQCNSHSKLLKYHSGDKQGPVTLNYGSRKKELDKINQDNITMLKSLNQI